MQHIQHKQNNTTLTQATHNKKICKAIISEEAGQA